MALWDDQSRLGASVTSRLGRLPFGAGLVGILALAASAGMISALPVWAAATLLACLIALALFVAMRLIFASPLPASVPGIARAWEGSAVRDAFTFPRLLYYGGALTVGQLTFRLPLNFTLSDWLFFAALLFAGFTVVVFHRRLMFEAPIPVFLGGLLFGAGSLLSSLDATQPLQSVAVGARVVYIVTLWFWLGTVLLRDLAQITTAVRLWTISAAITGAGAMAQLAWGDVIPGATPSWGRMTGFTPHMTDLGGITSLALAPALWMATRARGWGVERLVALATVVFIGAGLVLSGSVGSMLAAGAAVFVWLACAAIRFRSLAIAVVLIGLVVLSSLLVLEQVGGISPATRLQLVVEAEGEEGSLWSRLDAYQAAWEVIGRNPYVGVGLDDKSSRVDVMGLELLSDGSVIYTRHQVHNLLLGSWHGAGLLGVLGVLAILLGTLHVGIASLLRATSKEERLLAAALLASFAGFVVFAQGTVVLYQRYGWIGSALLIVLWVQQNRRLADAAEHRPASNLEFDPGSATPAAAPESLRRAADTPGATAQSL